MSYVFLVLALFVFLLALRHLQLVARVQGCLADIGRAVTVMRADGIDPDDKERAARRAARRMGGAFVDILMRTLAALLAPAALVVIGVAGGFYDSEEAIAAASDPVLLIALSVLALGLLRFAR